MLQSFDLDGGFSGPWLHLEGPHNFSIDLIHDASEFDTDTVLILSLLGGKF